MSRLNPDKAMAALMPLPIEIAPGVEVRPVTLGMWAALERIKSPLVTGEEPKDTLELIPSLYLLTHDPRIVLNGGLLEAAMAWADTLPVTAMDAIQRACNKHIDAALAVIPQKKTTDRAGIQTDSSPVSSTSPRQGTGGVFPKSSGTCRCRRSTSLKGKSGLTRTKSSRSVR